MGSFNEQTSSIGAVWPPAAATQERIRGFYTEGVITSQAEADRLASHVRSATEQMQASVNLTRVSVRVVVELGSLARVNFEDITSIEAVLPIAGTDLGIAYLGKNAPCRDMDAAHTDAHRNLLISTASRAQNVAEPISVEVVNPGDASSLVNDFAPLYQAFEYDAAQTEAILASHANTIAYANVDGRIVSTAMAERGTVQIAGYGALTLVEITEASTDPSYRQRGLYSKVSGYLTEHLVRMQQEDPATADVIYGESNLAMPGVIYAAHANGRRFSYFDRDQLGVDNNAFGILPQNFKVNDGVNVRPYNDFVVSYIPL